MSNTSRNVIIASALIAAGVAIAGYFVGNTIYKSRVAVNTVTVKGLAERRVEADQCSWKIAYSVSGKDKSEIPELYKKAEANRDTIVKKLEEGGLTGAEIQAGIISYSCETYRNEDNVLTDETHTLSGVISIETARVDQIRDIRAEVNQLLMKGLDIVNYSPQYRFTKLNEIKPDMLKEATKNARIAAKEFATHSGASVGKIRTARQGGFTIVDVGESYGDTKRLVKDVRVVTTAEFYISDK